MFGRMKSGRRNSRERGRVTGRRWAPRFELLEERRLLSVAPAQLVRDIDLKDVDPGIASGVAMGNCYYFAANDATHGTELWKSDGTAAGTVMVKDIYPGLSSSGGWSSSPTALTVIGGTLYFAANDGTDGTELWKSDGTAAGTVMVKDIYAGSRRLRPPPT